MNHQLVPTDCNCNAKYLHAYTHVYVNVCNMYNFMYVHVYIDASINTRPIVPQRYVFTLHLKVIKIHIYQRIKPLIHIYQRIKPLST